MQPATVNAARRPPTRRSRRAARVGQAIAPRNHEVAPAAHRVAQRPRRARRMVSGDVEQRTPARGQPRDVRAGAIVDQRQAHVQVRPADERRLEHGRAAVAGEQQRAAAGAGQVHAQRGGGAHGRIEVLRARRVAGIEDDERARVAVGAQPALHELAAARQPLPEDARRRRAGPVGAQAVEIDLGGDRRASSARRQSAAVALAGRRHHLLQAWQDEQLGGLVGGHHAGGQPERVADHDPRRRQYLAPAPGEARADVHLGLAAPADQRRGLGQQVVVDEPLGIGSRPLETTRSMTTGCSSIVRRAPTVRVTRTPRATSTPTATTPRRGP